MSNETSIKAETAQDSDGVAKTDTKTTETKEKEGKQRSVSFNRDVHVKRFGKPRERGTSSDQPPSIRREPFTHLSEQELINEANKVIAQAKSVTCTADHPPEKFFSLPHRRKFKDDKSIRRNSDDGGSPEGTSKTPLERSTSDVVPKRRKERTSLSTLFRRAQRTKSPDAPVVITTKPVVVKRSKSDVTDLKSNTNLNKNKPIRKRSGSETEEFLKSLRNKKSQLSPIIESSPREDYFKKVSPLEILHKEKLSEKESNKSKDIVLIDSKKVNPIQKPPRSKPLEQQEIISTPAQNKREKSSEKEPSPIITETPKRKTDIKKTNLFEETNIDETKNEHLEVKDRIKDSIRKIEENVYGESEMKHSSQQPPEKPPLTRGHTVDHIVRILKEDQHSPPPKSHLLSPPNGTNINQPFSYTKPSTSPDPNLFVRTTSPDRVPSPVNKMTEKGVVYAQVIRDNSDIRPHFPKQTMHKTFSPSRDNYGNFSDEDEGLGYEERYKYSTERENDFNHKNNESYNFNSGFNNVKESPIKPRFREYKLMSFEDFEPTYANDYTDKDPENRKPLDSYRGRADGMDTKKKNFEPDTKIDLNFNELSHRRELLESRLNARRYERDRINTNEPITKYIVENDPIYEAEKRMKQTEKYVNDTVKYYRHTLERDGFESTIAEDYKYDTDSQKIKYNTESRSFQKVPRDELDRREFIDNLRPIRYKEEKKIFPPEPEYEPPSLESNPGKPISSPDEYKEKKYRVKKHFMSSHDIVQGGQRYKVKDDWFGKRKGHYASNPEIAQEREDDYANLGYNSKHESYHNSLRRIKSKEKDFKNHHSSIRRHDSGDSRDYYREEKSPRRFDFDSRLVDSGIENDFRHNSNGDIHGSRHRRHESDDDAQNTSLFLASERQHTEDNYPSEQIYANGEYLANYRDYRGENRKDFISRDRIADDGSFLGPKLHRYEKSPSRHDEKISAKPPKATKKLSGLEKMKQLFSRDSSKKSKKEKEVVQPKTRTRVLKSPEHLAKDDSEYRRYTDPEPSDLDVRKRDDPREEKKYRQSREDLDRYRSSDPRASTENRREEKFRDSDYERRYERTSREDRRYKEHREENRRYNSSDRDSDHRPSDGEIDRRKTRSNTAGPLDSPALAQRNRERRRLATPSPTPSPPRRAPVSQSSGNWFKSMDRLSKKREKNSKIEKESIITTEDESSRRVWSKPTKPLNSPAKNLRFFGDTDHESDTNIKRTVTKTKSYPTKNHGTLRKTISNSSAGLDEVDHSELSNKSYSLSNLQKDKSESPKTKDFYKRNLKNISEVQSISESESQFGKKMASKPPISPYERSRSHSSSKTLKASKIDVKRHRGDDRGSSSELRSSKQELSRDSKSHRRTPVALSGESSTEGDSSHQSQRSVVYLHATTVGDIPDPGRVTRHRSRDDVSSVMSSNIQVRSTTKSFSLFAPWTPRHHNEQYDVHYEQKPRKSKKEVRKEEKPLQKKSYSQTTLNRRPNSQNRLTSSNTTLYRPKRGKENDISQSTISRKGTSEKKSQSSEILNRDDRERLSRSVSIPKDKKAGWFKLSKTKKQENTRVR